MLQARTYLKPVHHSPHHLEVSASNTRDTQKSQKLGVASGSGGGALYRGRCSFMQARALLRATPHQRCLCMCSCFVLHTLPPAVPDILALWRVRALWARFALDVSRNVALPRGSRHRYRRTVSETRAGVG